MTGLPRKRIAIDAWVLTDIVTRLRRVLRASIRSDYPWEKLPMAQIEILQRLHAEPGLRVNDLAERHRLANNTVSVLVQQLVVAGLVNPRARSRRPSRGTTRPDRPGTADAQRVAPGPRAPLRRRPRPARGRRSHRTASRRYRPCQGWSTSWRAPSPAMRRPANRATPGQDRPGILAFE